LVFCVRWTVPFKRLYLRRERPGELVESAFRAVLLRDIFDNGRGRTWR